MLDEELVAIDEVAKIAGVSRQAVANWRKRFGNFPSPVAEWAAGPLFRRSQVRSWLRKRRVLLANVLSTINLKGGVGKTTTPVALAEFMSGRNDMKVLVIDLDPQTNATVMLIGESRWGELNEKEWTLARLFRDALSPDERGFDLD